MPLARLPRFSALILISLFPLFSASGCLTPYGIPRVEHTPTIVFNSKVEEVRAFRVDETAHLRDMMFIGLPNAETCVRLRELPVTSSNRIVAQDKVSFERGLV